MQLSSDLQKKLLKIREEGEEREAQQRALRLDYPYIDLGKAPVQVDALKILEEGRARDLRIALFELKKKKIALATINPEDVRVKNFIKELEKNGYTAKIFIVSLRGLERVWGSYQYVPKERVRITGRVNIEKEEIARLQEELKSISTVSNALAEFDFSKALITEFLEIVFGGAIANRVSDIHFEPEESLIKLRYRIDGLLHDVSTVITQGFYKKIVSRIKLLSNLKINLRDQPQDGRFTIGLSAKEIEIRVAIAPAEFGEIVVLRVLNPDTIGLTLSELGLRSDDLEIVKEELKKPNGMILNTGPTGSGKTTTLYAFLESKNNPEIKIITIEDPVEYHLQGIEQTQINEEAHYTFANGLRSIMRQDPDIILVGEIRDHDTAEIALQAALTGHLVFSTLHTNNAAGAVPRLLDLGVKASSIAPALNLVIAQRLVRKLCEYCKKEKKVTALEKKKYEVFLSSLPERVDISPYREFSFFKPGPKGCDKCGGFGYKGRVGVFELFIIDKEIEELITKGTSETKMKDCAKEHGMVTMQEDGILKALQGVTSIDEVETITGKVEWRVSAFHK